MFHFFSSRCECRMPLKRGYIYSPTKIMIRSWSLGKGTAVFLIIWCCPFSRVCQKTLLGFVNIYVRVCFSNWGFKSRIYTAHLGSQKNNCRQFMVPEIFKKRGNSKSYLHISGQAVASIIGCKIYLVQHRMNGQYLEEDFLFRLFLCLSYS